MWFKGEPSFPEALLLLSVGGGVWLRGRGIDINIERDESASEVLLFVPPPAAAAAAASSFVQGSSTCCFLDGVI